MIGAVLSRVAPYKLSTRFLRQYFCLGSRVNRRQLLSILLPQGRAIQTLARSRLLRKLKRGVTDRYGSNQQAFNAWYLLQY